MGMDMRRFFLILILSFPWNFSCVGSVTPESSPSPHVVADRNTADNWCYTANIANADALLHLDLGIAGVVSSRKYLIPLRHVRAGQEISCPEDGPAYENADSSDLSEYWGGGVEVVPAGPDTVQLRFSYSWKTSKRGQGELDRNVVLSVGKDTVENLEPGAQVAVKWNSGDM
jgi:hypothetical protein